MLLSFDGSVVPVLSPLHLLLRNDFPHVPVVIPGKVPDLFFEGRGTKNLQNGGCRLCLKGLLSQDKIKALFQQRNEVQTVDLARDPLGPESKIRLTVSNRSRRNMEEYVRFAAHPGNGSSR